jgi:hypothetical protein
MKEGRLEDGTRVWLFKEGTNRWIFFSKNEQFDGRSGQELALDETDPDYAGGNLKYREACQYFWELLEEFKDKGLRY